MTMKSVYVCKNPHEKAMQRALIQYRNPKNYELVREALKLAKREDLIGYDKKCLIKPRKKSVESANRQNHQNKKKTPSKPVKQTAAKKKTIRNIHKHKQITRGH